MMGRRQFIESGLATATLVGASKSSQASAKNDSAAGLRSTGAAWPLRGSEAFHLVSKEVGDEMAIGVWSHPNVNPLRAGAGGAPLDVVYVLDGAFALGPAATICMLQSADIVNPGYAPVLLVGVDYPVNAANGRNRDYTMRDAVPPSLAKYVEQTPQIAPGGADKFLSFLENELDPIIRRKYNTSDRPAGIIGDSFGGTFAFYAFISQSKMFNRYWLGSPGIFTTTTDHVARFRDTLKQPLVHPTKMYLSMGSKEMAAGVDFYEDMGRNYNRIISALHQNTSSRLTWSSKVYDGGTHTSTFIPAMNDALIYLYGNSGAV